jgi:hypothetical protein
LKRATRLAPLLALLLAACGHEVQPTEQYDMPEEIPVPTMLVVRPAVFGPYLTWDTPDSDFVIVAGWHVYRRRPDGDERRLTTEPLVMRQYQDPDTPQVGQTFYWVTAESRGGVESLPTPTVRFLWDDQPPMPPTGLTAQASTELVALRWQTGLEFDLAGYRVERDESKSASSAIRPCQPSSIATSRPAPRMCTRFARSIFRDA